MKPRQDLLHLCALFVASGLFAAPSPNDVSFEKEIRPLFSEYCLKCHSTEKHKGDLDLERFSSLADVKKHPKIWQNVVEQLASNEMPPKDKPQPTQAQREQVLNWASALLDEIA